LAQAILAEVKTSFKVTFWWDDEGYYLFVVASGMSVPTL